MIFFISDTFHFLTLFTSDNFLAFLTWTGIWLWLVSDFDWEPTNLSNYIVIYRESRNRQTRKGQCQCMYASLDPDIVLARVILPFPSSNYRWLHNQQWLLVNNIAILGKWRYWLMTGWLWRMRAVMRSPATRLGRRALAVRREGMVQSGITINNILSITIRTICKLWNIHDGNRGWSSVGYLCLSSLHNSY